jgi:hypothetical protein
MPTKPYKEHLLERLQTPEDCAGYLQAALESESDSPESIALVLRDICEAKKLPITISTRGADDGLAEAVNIASHVENANDLNDGGFFEAGFIAARTKILDALIDARDATRGADPAAVEASFESWWEDYVDAGRHQYHELLHPDGIAKRIAKDAWDEAIAARSTRKEYSP